ncbi:MAG: methionine synthase [Chloroflexota bacterium]|nr:methionine synthase [Chloroflexota bacterium]
MTELLTTVIGTYPLDNYNAAPEQPRLLSGEQAIRRAVEDQIAAGVKLISDGEVRSEMVGLFAAKLPGYHLRKGEGSGRQMGGWHLNKRVEPAPEPIAVNDYLYARKLAGDRAEVKAIITGATTMAMSTTLDPEAPYKHNLDPELILDIARALAEEAKQLRKAGCRVIQVDEPVMAYGADVSLTISADSLIWKEAEFPVLHCCGDTRNVLMQLLAAPIAALEVEGKYIPDIPLANHALLGAKGLKIGYGCINTAKNDVETVEYLVKQIRIGVEQLGIENMWVNPDCGMRLRKRDAAFAKLKNMCQAARIVIEAG